jgi:hypothetical protein
MEYNANVIRTEIIRILNENGRTRGTELVKRVIKKTGNEKAAYRKISALLESGEIERIVHSKSHIEYEIVNLSESANKQLKIIHKELDIALAELKEIKEPERIEKDYRQRIRTTICFIHMVQSIESVMRLLSYYPMFKKDRMFSQINRKISDYWQIVMGFIMQQPEEEFLNEVLANIMITYPSSENVN